MKWPRRVSKLHMYVKTIDPILAAHSWKPIYKRLMNKPAFSKGFYSRRDIFSETTRIHLQSRLSPFQYVIHKKAI